LKKIGKLSPEFPITISELMDKTPGKSNKWVRAFWKVNDATAKHVEKGIYPRLQTFKPISLVRVPVLFWNDALNDKFKKVTAFTPNLANGVLLNDTFLMPKPFVLRLDATDPDSAWLFERETNRRFPAAYTTKYTDDYFSCHIWESEVHCASFVIRKPKTGGPYWWVKQK